MTPSNAVTEFWRLFGEKCAALARIKSADEPVYDELLECLQCIDPGLYLELSAKPGDCELIITAEGDSELFDMVDSVVRAAPQTSGWTIHALRPKLGFPKAVGWEGYKVVIADVVFEPWSEKGSNDLGLRLLVPGLNEADIDDAHNALLRAIDHGLGERTFATEIQHTEVAPLEGPTDDYIPLVDLENFIRWRKERRKH